MTSRISYQPPSLSLAEVETFMLALIRAGQDGSGADAPKTVHAASYHLTSGGQRVRARLALHAGRSLGLGTADTVVIASAVELLHNASLVHDDLQDRAMLRRGTETVWAAYGANLAVCTGDLLLSAAYAALASFSNSMVVPELMGLLHARTSQAIHGQCEDLSTEVRLIDLAAYERMVAGKSGALLRLPLELVFLGSGHREWLGRARQAAETFGLGYQIVDDLEDAEADAERFGDWPNILHVLRAKGNNAWTAARALGMQKLEEAEELAASLPNQSGALLQDLSRALRERL